MFLQKKKVEKQQEQPARDTTEIDYRTEEETREDAVSIFLRAQMSLQKGLVERWREGNV